MVDIVGIKISAINGNARHCFLDGFTPSSGGYVILSHISPGLPRALGGRWSERRRFQWLNVDAALDTTDRGLTGRDLPMQLIMDGWASSVTV